MHPTEADDLAPPCRLVAKQQGNISQGWGVGRPGESELVEEEKAGGSSPRAAVLGLETRSGDQREGTGDTSRWAPAPLSRARL